MWVFAANFTIVNPTLDLFLVLKDQKLNQNWLWVLAADFMSVNPSLVLFLECQKGQKLKPKVIASFSSQFYECKSNFRLVFRVSHCTKDEIKVITSI